MISTKQLHMLEIMEYILFAAMHVVYSAWTKDDETTWQVIIYAVIMCIITMVCLLVLRKEFWRQVGFSLCVVFGVHLIGTAMGSLAFGICIFMAAGTLLSIYGDRHLNWYYLLIVNMAIAFGLIMEYDVIVSRVPIEYYVMMILTCEIYLMTESYMVLLYQQKVEEIQIQNELLSMAQKSKDEFLANMSHEIRTPMNAIVGMSELILREEGNNPKIDEYCHSIQSSGQNLLTLINDILDFSKIESGKMSVVYEPYSIAAVIQNVVNSAMFRRGYKDISIIVDVSPMIPRLLNGDAVRIQQIMTNIITNAVKYTEKGYVFIEVSCEVKDRENYLEIKVRDSGIGIKKEDLAHLFESFRRMDTKKNRSIEGTGLGLPICKRLVELMHGTIRIQSEYGVGTTVTIQIPQRIIDSSPALVLKNDNIEIAAYLDKELRKDKERNELYRIANANIWSRLNVTRHVANSFDKLLEVLDKENITHIITGADEYREYVEFLSKVSDKIMVYVIHDPRYNMHFKGKVNGIHMPFCSISIVTALNGETFYSQFEDDDMGEFSFTAPEATILIVDDNELNLKVAEGILNIFHAKCILADSGRKALDMLAKEHVDIVFMDHMMPEMDGVETTKIIRQTGEDSFRNVPIIAMTANVANDVKQQFLSNGFQDFLPKPISVKSVGAVLKHWLPRKYIVYGTDNVGDGSESEACGGMEKSDAGRAGIEAGSVEDDAGRTDTEAGRTENDAGRTDIAIGSSRADSDKGDSGLGKPDPDSAVNKEEKPASRPYVEINAEAALENMGGQRDLYKELLEYCLELEGKRWDDIQKVYDDKNWPEYTIQVHALKGGMRSLGIEELALAAQGQEFASREGRIDDVTAGHGPLKELYDWTHRSIEHYLETFEV